MNERHQLFTRTGIFVATVRIPWETEVVRWKDKLYIIKNGRYVEGRCSDAYADIVEQPANIADSRVTIR